MCAVFCVRVVMKKRVPAPGVIYTALAAAGDAVGAARVARGLYRALAAGWRGAVGAAGVARVLFRTGWRAALMVPATCARYTYRALAAGWRAAWMVPAAGARCIAAVVSAMYARATQKSHFTEDFIGFPIKRPSGSQVGPDGDGTFGARAPVFRIPISLRISSFPSN
jgi:hypothetical protein